MENSSQAIRERSVKKSEQAAEDRNSIAVVQSTVFPYSEPHLSSGDSNVSLAWLYDNPQRTAINRSMAVSSRWNGAAWSEPQAFADDGTSDFHPRLLVFPDGSALAAWEDIKRILPDTAALADVVSNLEITASFYDPQLDRWSSAQRITANGYLDGSPRLAGTSPDDALLVWISNDQNDLRGGAAKPNTLWSAKWNGDVWSTPQAVSIIPHGVVNYAIGYMAGQADVILSLDTGDDQTVNNNRELYGVHYANGVWGSLTR